MKDYSSWVLKDPNNLGIELIFDESEMSIQRDLKSLWKNILYFLILELYTLAIFSIYYEKKSGILYPAAILMIGIMLFIIYQAFLIWTEHKKNERVYSLSEIQLVHLETRKNKVKIVIEFKGGEKDKIQVFRSNYLEIFIETLRKNSIEIKENNKR